jgi:ribA/ribD-fused uncharacterized protein
MSYHYPIEDNDMTINLAEHGITVRNGFALFWGGPFSNWFKRKTVVDGQTFSSNEQWMMYSKAMLFNDVITAKKILQTSDPRKQKALGREVKGYDDTLWNDQRALIVLAGCFEKFVQHDDLAEVLLATEDLEIVEASPYDTIWGIGLAAEDPRATDKSQWKGQNLLGKVTMDVRAELKILRSMKQ